MPGGPSAVSRAEAAVQPRDVAEATRTTLAGPGIRLATARRKLALPPFRRLKLPCRPPNWQRLTNSRKRSSQFCSRVLAAAPRKRNGRLAQLTRRISNAEASPLAEAQAVADPRLSEEQGSVHPLAEAEDGSGPGSRPKRGCAKAGACLANSGRRAAAGKDRSRRRRPTRRRINARIPRRKELRRAAVRAPDPPWRRTAEAGASALMIGLRRWLPTPEGGDRCRCPLGS